MAEKQETGIAKRGRVVLGCHGYLGNVLLHGLEVKEGDVDQVAAVDYCY